MSPLHPIVSIGMPVFNGALFLTEAIESILCQSLRDLELIIFDNDSTDDTESICRQFAADDERIQYHRNTENVGAHPNYNLTFRHATGKYFKWAAHDDKLEPQYVEACVGELEQSPDAVICQSYLQYIDAAGDRVGVYNSRLIGSNSASASARFSSVVLLPHPAYEIMGVFRRSALENSLLLQSFHGADRALLAQMSLRGRFVQVKQPLLLVRDHEDRYTHSHVRPQDRAVWHDAKLKGTISLPTWRLYYEYCTMIKRDLDPMSERIRCYGHLIRWWWHNWNAVRMLVDLVSVIIPSAVVYAERLKQRFIAPQPGAGEVGKR